MKPKLKPPGTKRLKLQCDLLLSSYAFKFGLRRYTMAAEEWTARAEAAFREINTDKMYTMQQALLTLVHIRAQHEQLQDTFTIKARLHGRQRSSS